MDLQTFKWKVLVDSSGGKDFRVRKVQFGDGYEQVAGDGINNKKTTHNLRVIGNKVEMREVCDFLEAHSGYIPFIYKDPFDGEGVFLCDKYSFDPIASDLYKVSFTAKQAYL